MDHFKSPEFSARVEELLKKYHVAGFSIAIVHNDATASAGYGMASLDPPRPCTADTLFDIASTSKSLTATGVALLIEDDDKYPEVQWEAKMSDLLPEDFVMADKSYTDAITVEDILTHRTGLPGHDDSYMGPRAEHTDNARSITRNLRNLPLITPIRTRYIYNNMMFTVASHLIETKTRLSFSDFLQERFFGPLGMSSSHLQPSCTQAKGLGDRLAIGYRWDEEAEEYKAFPPLDCPEGQGAGSIVSSVNDFIKWVKATMNHESPISEEIYESLVKSRTLANPKMENLEPFTSPTLVGAGWEVYYYRGWQVVEHDGTIPGFRTNAMFLPKFKFGCVAFSNGSEGREVVMAVTKELLDEFLEVPKAERPGWEEVISKELGGGDEDGEEEDDDDDDSDSELEKVRQELCPGIKEPQPQTVPLSAYTGRYSDPGYHDMYVQIKDNRLFIDATDRSMAFSASFEHVCDQKKYVAHFTDYLEDNDEPLKAEFVFEGDKVVRMGLELEDILDEVGQLIWFEKAE